MPLHIASATAKPPIFRSENHSLEKPGGSKSLMPNSPHPVSQLLLQRETGGCRCPRCTEFQVGAPRIFNYEHYRRSQHLLKAFIQELVLECSLWMVRGDTEIELPGQHGKIIFKAEDALRTIKNQINAAFPMDINDPAWRTTGVYLNVLTDALAHDYYQLDGLVPQTHKLKKKTFTPLFMHLYHEGYIRFLPGPVVLLTEEGVKQLNKKPTG